MLVACAFAVTMLGTTLPTPLYPLYRQHLDISGLMITVIFAVYAAGVIGALFLFGSWSDQLGRRRIILVGLGLSGASAIAFLVGGSLAPILIGRVLSGLSAGILTGTGTVAIIELAPGNRRALATLVATAANMGGLGIGSLLAGLLAEYAPLPLRLSFIVDLALIVSAVPGVRRASEAVKPALHPRLRPQRLRLPAGVRGAFIPAAIAGFAGFAVMGLFSAVAPAFMVRLLGISNLAVVGAVVLAIFAASVLGQLALELTFRDRAFAFGCVILAAGAGFVAAGVGAGSLALLIAGAVVCGLGQGLSFRAGLASVTAASPGEHRGEVTSTFFVVLYVALSIPVIGVGLAARPFGLRTAGVAFAIGVALLALIALGLLHLRGRHD